MQFYRIRAYQPASYIGVPSWSLLNVRYLLYNGELMEGKLSSSSFDPIYGVADQGGYSIIRYLEEYTFEVTSLKNQFMLYYKKYHLLLEVDDPKILLTDQNSDLRDLAKKALEEQLTEEYLIKNYSIVRLSC